MMRKFFLTVTACLLAAATLQAEEAALTTDEQKTLYAMGFAMARQMPKIGLEPSEVQSILRGIEDGLLDGDAEVEIEVYGPKIESYVLEKRSALIAREKELGRAYVEKAVKEPGAVLTETGMVYFELEAGTGATPVGSDSVSINYRGSFLDGKVFDSSAAAGTPVTFKLDDVPPCFSQGLQRMKVGGKSKFVCPSDLAYGDRGLQSIPPGATLIFEVEFLEIVTAAPAAPATGGE